MAQRTLSGSLVSQARMSDDLRTTRQSAVEFVIGWLAQSPTLSNLAAVASSCNWQIEEVDDLVAWIIRHPNCPAEAVLKLLDASGFWNLEETRLREDDAFALFDEMMEGLRARRYSWAAAPRTATEPFPFEVKIPEWRGLGEIDLIPLSDDIKGLGGTLPDEIKDALELLGAHFGERTANVARRLLIDKGYDPSEL